MDRQLIFVGAQGTGKTTVLNIFKEKGWKVITEVVRQLNKDGVKINKEGDIKGQTKIFEKYSELLRGHQAYVSDRGLIDVAAYTYFHYLDKDEQDFKTLFTNQYLEILEFNQTHPNALYVYFPIEFDVVEDGTRSMDEDFRKSIDGIIKTLVTESGHDYIEVHGTPEERVADIELKLKQLDEEAAEKEQQAKQEELKQITKEVKAKKTRRPRKKKAEKEETK